MSEANFLIPYAKAELEFNLWFKLYKKYDKSVEELGCKFIENESFPINKNAAIVDISFISCKKNTIINNDNILIIPNNKKY